ncbi:MAG: hypothetical protein HKN20_14555 [Gemmatimonadetes bacterium]|nr:hypothetical protein [Gemmatimonadota bacterium]
MSDHDNRHPDTAEDRRAGLCASCMHARLIESDRGSRFLLCALSRADSRFRKYPTLPVTLCAGYEKSC